MEYRPEKGVSQGIFSLETALQLWRGHRNGYIAGDRPFKEMRRIIMVKKMITVELASGLEARPAAMLVQVASQYESKIYLEAEAKRVNAKSIMGMMTLCLTAGQPITVEADGKDEEAAVTEIERYLKNQ